MQDLTTSIGADASKGEASRVLNQLKWQLAQLEKNGFNFDIRQRTAAHRLMLAWHADNSIGRLEELLAPIFARDADQQRRFYEIAGTWDTRPVPVSEAAQISSPSTPAEKQSGNLWLAPAVITALILAIALSFWQWEGPQAPVIEPPRSTPTQTPELAPGATRTQTITLREHWLETIKYRSPLVYLLPLLPALAFLYWLIWFRILPARSWLGEEADENADPGWLPLPRLLRRRLLSGVERGTALGDLQRGRDEPTGILDTTRTIDATVRQGGALVPVYERRSFGAEYLMLIERRGPHDHLATLFELTVQRLLDEGIRIERFFYRDDPRFLYVPEDKKTWRLNELVARFQHCRLVIIATPEGYFHPLSGDPEPWLERLSSFSPRAVMNTRPLAEWDWRELELFEQGFSIAIAGSDGLNRVSHRFGYAEDHGAALLGVKPADAADVSEPPPSEFAQPTPSAEPVKIFISYSHADQEFETRLRKGLSQFDHEPLLSIFSMSDLKGSENERSAILWRELNQADIVLFLLSPSSLASQYFQSEIRVATDARKQIIPIQIAPCDWQSTPLGPFKEIARPDSGWEQEFWDKTAWKIRAAAIKHRSIVFKHIEADWCPEMVLLPPGRFDMGSTEYENEQPVHEVHFKRSFAIGHFPVTFLEFDHFCEQTGRTKPEDEGWGRGRRPVINVSWEDAKAYVAWLSEAASAEYRLPSEAEWEYACRAGTTTRFAFGDELTNQLANFQRKIGKIIEIGSYPPNAFGLHDTHGNVWEWVGDAYHDSYNGAPNDGSAHGTTKEGVAVLRGGSWYLTQDGARCANRGRLGIDDRGYDVGFRVACSSPILSSDH